VRPHVLVDEHRDAAEIHRCSQMVDILFRERLHELRLEPSELAEVEVDQLPAP
jgi:hypothetical protein